MNDLKTFLSTKPLYHKKIDFERMPKEYAKIKDKIKLKNVIHIVGTNGKGSTGRYLSLMLKDLGFKVGHFTSPHIYKFNERIWINGKDIEDKTLEKLHKKLFKMLENPHELSYFEYTTFLAALSFKKCDFVILEAGLGGELDATNVFDKILSIITPISYDHENIFKNDIKYTAFTKINSVKTNFILANQEYHEVVKIAKQIAKEKNVKLIKVSKNLPKDIKIYAKEHNLPKFLAKNLYVSLIALNKLGHEAKTFPRLDLRGRFEKINKNIYIDVGHNVSSAKIIAKELKNKKITLIYNSYANKDIYHILKILKPNIKKVKILPMQDTQRKVGEKLIKKSLKKLEISYENFDFKINKDEKYLVFGSFLLINTFLKWYHER